jgi:hypothetical protein
VAKNVPGTFLAIKVRDPVKMQPARRRVAKNVPGTFLARCYERKPLRAFPPRRRASAVAL